MSVSIRQAVLGDEVLIFDYICRLAEYEKLRHEVKATADDIKAELFGEKPRAFSDLAFWNNQPAGFALWFYNYSTFSGRCGMYLEDLFVDQSMRGHGIGKALLKHLARRCVDEGLRRLQWSVLDWNTPSIEFYKSLGAQAQDEWTVYRVSGPALRDLALT